MIKAVHFIMPCNAENAWCSARIRKKHSRSAGFSYVEVLVSIVLIAIVLVPAMDALLPGIQGSTIHETRSEDHYQLTGKIEQVLAEPYTSLEAAAIAAGSPATATTYSGVYTYPDGHQITLNIFISRYDADDADGDNDPFTGTDDGLLWLRGEIADSAMGFEVLTSVYD